MELPVRKESFSLGRGVGAGGGGAAEEEAAAVAPGAEARTAASGANAARPPGMSRPAPGRPVREVSSRLELVLPRVAAMAAAGARRRRAASVAANIGGAQEEALQQASCSRSERGVYVGGGEGRVCVCV